MFGLDNVDCSSPALAEGTSGFFLCRTHTPLMSPRRTQGRGVRALGCWTIFSILLSPCSQSASR